MGGEVCTNLDYYKFHVCAFGGSSLQLSTRKAKVQQRASIRKYKGLADLQAKGEGTRYRGRGGVVFLKAPLMTEIHPRPLKRARGEIFRRCLGKIKG